MQWKHSQYMNTWRLLKTLNAEKVDMPSTFLDILLIFILLREVDNKAMMIEPPHRLSLWRYDKTAPVNTKDDMLNCGGYEVQWEQNGGLCDVCGQPFNGLLVDGTEHKVIRSYKQGAYVNVTVEVKGNLLGYFEFRLCPRNSSNELLSHECFERNMLWIEESWSTRYYVGSHGGIYDLHVRLPADTSCSNCVFQWKYSTGYRMGGINECQCMGCGRQETFYNCADIEIQGADFQPDSNFVSTEINVHEPVFLISDKNLTDSKIDDFRRTLPTFMSPTPHEIHKHGLTANKRLFPINDRTKNIVMGIIRDAIGNIQSDTSSPLNSHIKFKANLTFPLNLVSFQKGKDYSTSFWDRLSRKPNKSSLEAPQKRTKAKSFWENISPRTTSSTFPSRKTGRLIQARYAPSHSRFFNHKSSDSMIFPLFSLQSTLRPTVVKNGDCYPTSRNYRCKGVGQYSNTRGISQWCRNNCSPNHCFKFVCECGCDDVVVSETKCHAVGPYEDVFGMDEWCSRTCSGNGKCPASVCSVKDCQNGS